MRSGDSEEDGIPNFTMMFATWLEGVNMSSSSNTCNNGKRKERECSEVQVGEKKSSGIGLQLLLRWDQMVDSMSNNSDSTSINRDR